jgi:hypothetical protein
VPEHLARRLWGPTRARPGSFGKVEVLGLRVDWGLPLWHPLDARGDGGCAAEGVQAAALVRRQLQRPGGATGC